jgi:hypothetical protein
MAHPIIMPTTIIGARNFGLRTIACACSRAARDTESSRCSFSSTGGSLGGGACCWATITESMVLERNPGGSFEKPNTMNPAIPMDADRLATNQERNMDTRLPRPRCTCTAMRMPRSGTSEKP